MANPRVLFLLMLTALGITAEQVMYGGTCFERRLAEAEFQRLQFNSSLAFERLKIVARNCFNPSVTRNFDAISTYNCAQMTYGAKLNSFSFEDGMCTGYSFWIDSSSELVVDSAGEDSMVLYVADSQLTQYQENEKFMNIEFPSFYNVEYIATGSAGSAGEVSINISGLLCLITSVDEYYDGTIHASHSTSDGFVKFSTDQSFCRASQAVLEFNMGRLSKNSQKHDVKILQDWQNSTVSVQVHRVGFKDFDAGNKSLSTFEFRVEGDYSKVTNYHIKFMYGVIDSPLEEYISGGQERYTLRYAFENGICYKYLLISSYHITPLDRFNCFLDGELPISEQLRDSCGREGTTSPVDYCSHCVASDVKSFNFQSAKPYCNSPFELMPKVDSLKILQILDDHVVSTKADTFWIDYTRQNGTWLWKDGETVIDQELINTDEFENQTDSVGDCSVVKGGDGAYKILKTDCLEEHNFLCITPAPLDIK